MLTTVAASSAPRFSQRDCGGLEQLLERADSLIEKKRFGLQVASIEL